MTMRNRILPLTSRRMPAAPIAALLSACLFALPPTDVRGEENAGWGFQLPAFELPGFEREDSAEEAAAGPTIPLPAPTAPPASVSQPAAPAGSTDADTPISESDPSEIRSVAYTPDTPLPVPDPPLDLLPPGENAPAAPDVIGSAIGDAIADGINPETAPLVEETESWYQIPWRWVTEGWDNHAELGLDGSSGNARTFAFQTGLETKRKTDRYTLSMDFDYRKATNRSLTTEDNGRFNVDYDQLFKESRWSGFGKLGAEWDQFKAFDLRINLNGGVGYHFVRTDDATFVVRFGAGSSKEIGAPDDSWKPEAVFGSEAEYQVNRYNKMKGKVDYFPAWEDFSDYRLVTDLAWEILLDDTDNLSLKLAVTDRYDSTPQGAKPNDVYYSLLLLVKF